MTDVEVTVDAEAQREHAFKGQWWRPEDPAVRVGGTLEFAAGKGGSLELHGGLCGDNAPPWPQVIFGQVDGKDVTLTDAIYSGHVSHGLPPRTAISKETWRCQSVLMGMHAVDGNKTTFDFFELATANLPQWVDRPAPRISHKSVEQITIEIQLPAGFTADIEGVGSIELWWTQNEHRSHLSTSIRMSPRLRFRPSEQSTVRQAWTSFVTPMLFFMTFATGGTDYILSLRAGLDSAIDRPYEASAEVLVSRWAGEIPSGGEINRWQHLLAFAEVEARFDDLLSRWFNLFGRTRDSMLDFFSVVFTPFMYGEESFVRIVRSMESWHRARIGGTYMDRESFAALLGKLRDSLDSDEWKFAQMRLQYGNERTLKQRLDELIALAGEPITSVVSKYKRFSRRVVETRNSLTHEGKLGDAFTQGEVFWAQKSLEHVFRSVLLRELGFTDQEVARNIARTSEWQWFASPQNVLAYWREYEPRPSPSLEIAT